MKKFVIFSFMFLLATPFFADAFNFKTGSDLYIDDQSDSVDNLYLFGGNVKLANQFPKDLFVVSGESDLNGNFLDDVEVLSGKLFLSGVLESDARLFGGEININGETQKDLFVVAGKVNINSDAIIKNKTMIIAGEVNLNGKTEGDVKIVSAKTYINGEVNGKTEITTQNLILSNSANVAGDLIYFSPQKAFVDQSAKIKNELKFNQIEKINEDYRFKKVVLNLVIFWTVIKFLASLFIVLILVFVFKVFSQKVTQSAISKPFKSFFVGLATMFFMPVVCVILFASLFAIPISVILFLFYLILWILVSSVSGIILGFLLKKIKSKDDRKIEVDFNFSVIGVVLLTFVSFVPWLGEISKIILIPLSFGTMFLYFWEIVIRKKIIK